MILSCTLIWPGILEEYQKTKKCTELNNCILQLIIQAFGLLFGVYYCRTYTERLSQYRDWVIKNCTGPKTHY